MWRQLIIGVLASCLATTSDNASSEGSGIVVVKQVALEGHSWTATLSASGRLTVRTADGRHSVQIHDRQLDALLQLIREERFLELHDFYGTAVHHAPFREITVSLKGRSKTVVLLSELEADDRNDEVGRALRVAIAIRDLFDIPEAYDSRVEDRATLAAIRR